MSSWWPFSMLSTTSPVFPQHLRSISRPFQPFPGLSPTFPQLFPTISWAFPRPFPDSPTISAFPQAFPAFPGRFPALCNPICQGILMIEPKMDFVEKVCNETWTLEDGKITVQPLGEMENWSDRGWIWDDLWIIWDDFGMIWDDFGMIWGWFWDDLWIILGWFWDDLGWFGDDFGMICG